MADVISKVQLENASSDAVSFQLFINGDDVTDVHTRLGRIYPTLAKLAAMVQNTPIDVISGGSYPTTEAAQAAITAGQIPVGTAVSVTSPLDVNIYDMYYNNAGTLSPLLDSNGNQKVSISAEAVYSMISQSDNVTVPITVEDSNGFAIYTVGLDGTINSGSIILSPDSFSANNILLDASKLNLENVSFAYDAQSGLWLEGLNGFRVDLLTISSGDTVPDVDYEINSRNARNLAISNSNMTEQNTITQPPNANYNHILQYGQSLSTGFEGWPALSKTPYERLANKMFGGSPRPISRSNPEFVPITNSNLNPLKAVVQHWTGSPILTDAQVAALAPGEPNEGETSLIGAVNFWRDLFLDYYNLYSDPDRIFVASDTGVNGKTIEELSKTADPNLYNRFLQAVQKVKAIADAENKSYCVPAIFFMQGEWNYTAHGGTLDGPTYYALQKQLKDDMIADVMAITGQAKPPAFIIYQTGASFTNSDDLITIGQAQLDFSNNEPGCWMATPIYPYTDKNGHLDPNGYRNTGMQFGKVAHRICTARLGWKPTQPISYTVYGSTIIGDFVTSGKPLTFDAPRVILAAPNYPNKGFKVVDDLGTVGIAAVEIVAETVVKIDLSRLTSGDVYVTYGDKTIHNGNGSLRDLDETLSLENYVYNAGTGQYAAANIPELVNKPYNLGNWCAAHRIKAGVK